MAQLAGLEDSDHGFEEVGIEFGRRRELMMWIAYSGSIAAW